MKKWKRKQWILLALIVLTTALIFWQSLLTAEESTVYSDNIVQILDQMPSPSSPVVMFWKIHVRDLAHVFEFAVLGVEWLLLGLTWCRHTAWALLPGLLTAVVDEVIQYWVPGRATELIDVALDGGGFLLGWLLALGVVALVWLVRKKRDKAV